MKYLKTGLVLTLLAASSAHAEFSANVGYASEYHYRGIFQKNLPRSAEKIDFHKPSR